MSVNDIHFNMVLAHTAKITGFNAREYRPSTLKRRVEWRLSATNAKNYKDYLAFLKNNPSECYKFLDALFIKVTDFFRDKGVFFHLKRKILPGLIDRIIAKKRKKIAIWSIACSKGQEPYSLAMLLDETLKRKKEKIKVSILATDVSQSVLKYAQLAQYRKTEMKNIPQEYLLKYFKKVENGQYQVIDAIRKMVKFRHHDIIRGNSLGKYHLISCRNLFIFFTQNQQDKMFKKIHASLNKQGILVLGNAETPKNEKLFRCLSSQNHIYQKLS